MGTSAKPAEVALTILRWIDLQHSVAKVVRMIRRTVSLILTCNLPYVDKIILIYTEVAKAYVLNLKVH